MQFSRIHNLLNVNCDKSLAISDYYPFGMGMQERAYTSGSGGYRYGFNSMEQDNEVKGEGNSLDFGARIYDNRLGRWMSVDPYFKEYPFVSAYAAYENCPIAAIDVNGEKVYFVGGSAYDGKKQKQLRKENKLNSKKFDGAIIQDYSKIVGSDEVEIIESSGHYGPMGNAKWSVLNASTVLDICNDKVLIAVRDELLTDFKKAQQVNPKEPLHIVSASYGTVVTAQVVIDLYNSGELTGVSVDVVFSNSMISQDKENPLYKELLRIEEDSKGLVKFNFDNTEGDEVSEIGGGNSRAEAEENWKLIRNSIVNKRSKHMHFVASNDMERVERIVTNSLQLRGVEGPEAAGKVEAYYKSKD